MDLQHHENYLQIYFHTLDNAAVRIYLLIG